MKIQDKAEFDKINDFGTGNPNDMFAKYFIGNSYLNPLYEISGQSKFQKGQLLWHWHPQFYADN